MSITPTFLGNVDAFQHTMEWVEPRDFVRCSAVCQLWNQNSKAVERAVFKPLHEKAEFRVENDMYSPKSFIVLKATTRLGHPRDLTIKYFGVPKDEDPPVTLKQIDRLSKPFNEKFWNYQMYSYIIKYTAVDRPIREGEIVAWDHIGNMSLYKKKSIRDIDQFKARLDAQKLGYAFGPTVHRIPISSNNMYQLARCPLEEGKIDGPIFERVDPEHWGLDYRHRITARSEFVCKEIPDDSVSRTWEQQIACYQPSDLVSLLFHGSFELRETGNNNVDLSVRTLDIPIFRKASLNFIPQKSTHVTLHPLDEYDSSTEWRIPLFYECDDEVFTPESENMPCGVVPCITAKEATNYRLDVAQKTEKK